MTILGTFAAYTKEAAITATVTIIAAILRRRWKMEKDIQLGSNADIDLKISGGKAAIVLKGEYDVPSIGGKFKSENSGEIGADVLLDKIFAEIEAKSPPGFVPIEEGVKLMLKTAVMAL